MKIVAEKMQVIKISFKKNFFYSFEMDMKNCAKIRE